MRILFITIPFYEYVNKIENTMKYNLNAEVDVFYLHKKRSVWDFFIDLFSKGRYTTKREISRQKKYFNSLEKDYYDYIFVLVGRGLSENIFLDLLKNQKSAKKILYLWDNIERIEEYNWMNPLFNTIYTFCDVDAKNYNLKVLPLFYCDEYNYHKETKEYDLFFTGNDHSDREEIIKKVLSFFPNKSVFILLNSTRRKQILKILKRKKLKIPFYITYKTIIMKENANIMKRSKIVLDIPFPGQNGLSIRTIESLATNTKLITTNKNIEKYDFYNKHNICIIDRTNPFISNEFINDEFAENSKSVTNSYSLNEWVQRIFNNYGNGGNNEK